MRLWCGALISVLTLAGTSVSSAQGPPPPPPPMPVQGRDAGPQKTGTARLSGRVTSLDTGRAIRRAVVRVAAPDLRDGKSVSTDAEGRWELRELPAGRYSVSVTKGGFVSLSYGQRRPFEAGKSVDVAEGQAVEKLDVALPRGSAITGRVVDEFGEPVINARVSPMRYRFSGGQRRLVTAGAGDMTDDLGQFRLHGLAPADYYVAAQPTGFTFVGRSEDRTGYGQTFYPGAQNPSEATRVTLAVGQEAQNIVIALSPMRVATLSGTARLSSGKPIAQGMLMLRDQSPSGLHLTMPALVRDGTWSMSGVPPGEYQMMIQTMDAAALERATVTGSTAGMNNSEFASEQINVSGDDIRGIAIVTSAGSTVRGTIRFDGGAAPAAPPSMASVLAFESNPASMPLGGNGPIRPDWSFEIRGLSGRRFLRVYGLPQGWILKSVMVDGSDVTDTGLDVGAGQEVSGVSIVVTRRVTELSGTVQTTKGGAVQDFVVVLFPPEPERWGPHSRYVHVSRPDQTGRFLINGVPAGSYLAVALEYLEPGEETNPDFLERLKALGTSVQLAEAEKKAVTLKLSSQ